MEIPSRLSGAQVAAMTELQRAWLFGRIIGKAGVSFWFEIEFGDVSFFFLGGYCMEGSGQLRGRGKICHFSTLEYKTRGVASPVR